MRSVVRAAGCLGMLLSAASHGWAQAPGDVADAPGRRYTDHIAPILRKLCGDCHGPDDPEAGLDLVRFGAKAAVQSDLATWKTVYDQLETHAMPPSDSEQPTPQERADVLSWLADAFHAGSLTAASPRPTLRRLTRLEYNNTVRDLLGLGIDIFPFPERLPVERPEYSGRKLGDRLQVRVREYGAKHPVLLPQGGLPSDGRAAHGFANRGDAMNVSPLVLENYVALAGEIARSPKLSESRAWQELIAAVSAADELAAVRARLQVWLRRVFRRPASAEELDRYQAVWAKARSQGASFERAAAAVVQSSLASPAFLFLVDRPRPAPQETEVGARPMAAIDDHTLAQRLSYFLWSSGPDLTLQQLADAGTLHHPDQLAAQVERMLADRRARELTDSFAVQWLRLDQLYTAKPDRLRFKAFYAGPQGKGTLHAPFLVEALLLCDSIFVEDRSVLEFVHADYAWLNDRLCEHYGVHKPARDLAAVLATEDADLPGQPNRESPKKSDAGNTWQRCPLSDRQRGGMLTTGAVLTLTSLPERTSPVKRGAWVLETIFNRPPKEPKVAVSPLEKTAAGEPLTVRARLEQHRANSACAVCHDRIDPPGFALENFDPIGRWRTKDGDVSIDASGSLPQRRAFSDPAGFKRAILARQDEFVRAFVEHLLGYALGRELTWHDVPAVTAIVAAAKADGYRFSRIVHEIVRSQPFLQMATPE